MQIIVIHRDLRVIFLRQAARLIKYRLPVRIIQRRAHHALAGGGMEEITVGIIEADVHAAFNAEENQISRPQLPRAHAFSHMQQFAGGDALHRQVEAIFERTPDKPGAVDPALLRPAPLVGRSLPGMHLIVQRGDHRDQIVRTSVDGRVATLGGGFMRFR